MDNKEMRTEIREEKGVCFISLCLVEKECEKKKKIKKKLFFFILFFKKVKTKIN